MVCRGKAREVPLPRETRAFAVSARITLPNGVDLQAISTRLNPPVLSLDLWSRGCWQSARENHMVQLRQAQALAHHVRSVPDARPVILGGDFNAPAGDRIFHAFSPRLRDAFAQAGIGWGNSVTNDVPVSRFDQVWVSRRVRVAAVVSRKTEGSDHRMVICDLLLDH